MVPFDVVVVGSANLDLAATVERLPKPGETVTAIDYAEYAGGKGLNQAVAAARMGARTAFVGCIGDDDAGAFLRSVLQEEGIDASLVRVVKHPTGRAFISVDRSAENSIIVVPGANAHVHPVALPEARVLLMQLEIPLSTVVETTVTARAQGVLTVLNPAPACVLPREMLESLQVIVPNQHESTLLGGTDCLLEAGVQQVVTTLGARGAEIASRNGVMAVPSHRVQPVDTVGAGDAFTGAMCAMLAEGSTMEQAVRVAAVAGALATTVRGAVPSLPRREVVLRAFESGVT